MYVHRTEQAFFVTFVILTNLFLGVFSCSLMRLFLITCYFIQVQQETEAICMERTIYGVQSITFVTVTVRSAFQSSL